MSVKLYPPIISGVLPAFYLEYDSATGSVLKGGSITVPFTNNASVGESQVKGFSLRLRTASSGSYVLPPIPSNQFSYGQGLVTFKLTPKQASLLNEGQYYKIQIAYCGSVLVDTNSQLTCSDIGYYSTVGVAKCTSKPIVSIKGLEYESINAFNNEMFGLYDLSLCKDKTEKVYSYEFKVYDEQDNLFYTTGEQLHQAYYDTEYTSSLDRVILNDFASTDTIYSIEYNVTTLNGLQLSSPKYRISSQYLVSPNEEIQIKPEADPEHGTITVKFLGHTDPARSYYFLVDQELLNGLELDEDGQPLKDSATYTLLDTVINSTKNIKTQDKLAFLRVNTIYKHWIPETRTWYYVFAPNRFPNKTLVKNKYYNNTDVEGYNEEDLTDSYLLDLESYEKVITGKNLLKQMTWEYIDQNFINLAKEIVVGEDEREKKYYGSYLLSRASDADNYTTWFNIARFRLDDQVPSDFSIQDVTIEHGRKYKYALQQYNIWGLYSARTVSDVFEASFEDAYLYDGDKVLRIKYNPTVDSFKTTILEQKTDTIGGKYPFITRNGATYYKEFPLGGLLAQEIDDQYSFIDPEYGLSHRHATSEDDVESPKYAFRDYHMFSDSNIALERDFKLKVLEWLNNGKPKLFKSPYEGNYIVRLMNVSLSPVKELGRMLHSFTSQAYEIAECTYDNLVAYGFIKIAIPSDVIGLWKSYDLTDETLQDEDGNILIVLDQGIQSFLVQDMMPGDMIYLTFLDEGGNEEELPVMIGITGSYAYDNISKNLVKIKIPASTEHKTTGIINCFYEGMRITDFDSIRSTQLKTIISQQYVGVSPWMYALKTAPYTKNNIDAFQDNILQSQYLELQNYDFRTYLDKTVTAASTSTGGQVIVFYKPTDNFVKLAQSFDPGELLDRINLSINQGEKFKTELMKMEMMRFRQRPIIPVYTHQRWKTSGTQYVPGSYNTLLEEKIKQPNDEIFMVSTSPYGYPHPMTELTEYEMIDPFCVYQVLEWQADLNDWGPVRGREFPYYDPYYRTWFQSDYDPRVKMDFEWKQVALMEKYESIQAALNADSSLGLDEDDNLFLRNTSDEYQTLRELGLTRLSSDQNYLILLPESRHLYRENIINQTNKAKKERGEYIDRAVNEEEMYDYELCLSYRSEDTTGISHYYYIDDKGQTVMVESNKYDLFEKYSTHFYAHGDNNVIANKTYWVKKYNVVLNLTTEKVVEYKNIAPMNSYHIGNGVIAELTFQLRIVDYYTEIADEDVRLAKEKYLNAKAFYIELMKLYNNIAKSDINRQLNQAFAELYDRLLNGNQDKNDMLENYCELINSVLKSKTKKDELKLLQFYNIISINSALDSDALELLVDYKNKYNSSEEEVLTAFNNAKLLYYYETTATKNIDMYFLINAEEDKNYYIDTKYGILSENNTVTYYYKQFEEEAVFYTVNKNKYIEDFQNDPEHRENALIPVSNLVIVLTKFDKETGQPYFEVKQKDRINSEDTIFELETKKDVLTIETVALLNDEELESLKSETYYLAAQLVEEPSENIQYRNLYEEDEIQRVLNNQNFQGVADKLETLSKEIDKIKADIDDKQNVVDTLTLDYATSFVNMLTSVNEYNELVYTDWCARAIDEYFENTDYVFAGYARLVDLNTYSTIKTNETLNKCFMTKDLINQKTFYLTSAQLSDILDYSVMYRYQIQDAEPIYLFYGNSTYEQRIRNNISPIFQRYHRYTVDNSDEAGFMEFTALEAKIAQNTEQRFYRDGGYDEEESLKRNNAVAIYRPNHTKQLAIDSLSSYFPIPNNDDDEEEEQEPPTYPFALLVTDEEKFINYDLAVENLYQAISGDLPTVEEYLQMREERTGDELLDIYFDEQIEVVRGQIVLQFIAMHEALVSMFNILTKMKTEADQEEKDALIETLENAIVKYNVLYDRLIVDYKSYLPDENNTSSSFYAISKDYGDITGFINAIYLKYNNLLISEQVNYNTDESYFDLLNIATLSNYHNDIQFLLKTEVDGGEIVSLEIPSSDDNQETKYLTLQGFNYIGLKKINIDSTDYSNFSQAKQYYYNMLNDQLLPKLNPDIDFYPENNNMNFFDPINCNEYYNFFLRQLNELPNSSRAQLLENNYKNINTYWYRTTYKDQEIAGSIPGASLQAPAAFVWFIFNPANYVEDPRLPWLALNNIIIDENDNYIINFSDTRLPSSGPGMYHRVLANPFVLDIFSPIHKKYIITLYYHLKEIFEKILNEITGGNNVGIQAKLKENYIKDLRIERYKILNNYRDTEGNWHYGPVAIMKSKIDSAKIALSHISFGDGETYDTYVLKNFNKNILLKDVEFNIPPSSEPYYVIPYDENSTVIPPVLDEETNTWSDFSVSNELKFTKNWEDGDDNFDYSINWNQTIYFPFGMLDQITNIIQENNSATLEERGVYYEYLQKIYINELNRLNELLNQALILQGLYQKQTDVYSEKYENYLQEYETNRDLYLSYQNTEAMEYYKLLNTTIDRNDYDSDEEYEQAVIEHEREKQKRIQNYKRTVQEAWWAFINILDARYSAEKERGMYV